MTCQSVRENLLSIPHRHTKDELNSVIRKHLEACSDCAAELERLTQLDSLLLEGFSEIEGSPYFLQKLNARLDELGRHSFGSGWLAVWLRDRYLWTFATLLVVAVGLWLGFRHQQYEQLRSMEDVVRIQQENLRPAEDSDRGAAVPPPRNDTVAVVPEKTESAAKVEDTIPDEDLAVVENLELLQNYEFLKDLIDTSNGGDVRTN